MQHRAAISLLIVLLVLSSGFATLANPLREPKRIIGERKVDLQPLFHWWTNRSGPRPLKAWVRVTGSVVGTNSLGWVIEGSSEDPEQPKGSTKFVLQHPPMAEMAQFGWLKSQEDSLNRQRSEFAAQAKFAQERAKQIADQVKANHTRHLRSSGALVAEGRQWQQAETSANQSVKLLDAQLKPIQTQLKAFPDQAKYTVDCFALAGGLKVQGIPLYDRGLARE